MIEQGNEIGALSTSRTASTRFKGLTLIVKGLLRLAEGCLDMAAGGRAVAAAAGRDSSSKEEGQVSLSSSQTMEQQGRSFPVSMRTIA
jgi:hypothetical protein